MREDKAKGSVHKQGYTLEVPIASLLTVGPQFDAHAPNDSPPYSLD